jgi:putative ATP-dependent endonuclease of the OLD family
MGLAPSDKQNAAKDRCIAFQTDILVVDGASSATLRPRTLEEAIVYENFGLLRSDTLSIGIEIPKLLKDAHQTVYDRVRSDSFKKTDFAMNILACAEKVVVPNYIAEGLLWLEARLCPSLASETAVAAAAAIEVA